MIREAMREAVQLAAGDKREASRRFQEWLKAGGKERALAFFAEVRPHVPAPTKLNEVIAEVISEAKGDEEQALAALVEKLDPRENPTLHRAIARDTNAAFARYLAQVFEEELKRFWQQK